MPPPIREAPHTSRRPVSDLEFEQLVRTLKYTPNPLEDDSGKQWATDDLRRLYDAVVDNRTCTACDPSHLSGGRVWQR